MDGAVKWNLDYQWVTLIQAHAHIAKKHSKVILVCILFCLKSSKKSEFEKNHLKFVTLIFHLFLVSSGDKFLEKKQLEWNYNPMMYKNTVSMRIYEFKFLCNLQKPLPKVFPLRF